MSWVAVGVSVVGTGASLYGAKKDRDASADNQAQSQAYLSASSGQARQDVGRLFGHAQTARKAGFDTTQDIFQQFVPQQVGAFQHGNQQAQQTVGGTAQQQMNAIMGQPVDFSFLQPQQSYQPDYGFMNFESPIQEIPQTPGETDAAAITDQVDSQIYDAYSQYLGREPDPSGMEIYRRTVRNGTDYATTSGINKMIRAIQNSTEGKAYSQSQSAGNQGAFQGFGQFNTGGAA